MQKVRNELVIKDYQKKRVSQASTIHSFNIRGGRVGRNKNQQKPFIVCEMTDKKRKKK